MTPEAKLRAGLLANAAYNSAIGGRLVAVQIPENPVYPITAYQRISTVTTNVHGGLGTDVPDVGWCRFQFTTLAKSKTGLEDVVVIGQKLKEALRTFNCLDNAAPLTQAPNFVLNEQVTLQAQPSGLPVAVLMLDAKVYFSE